MVKSGVRQRFMQWKQPLFFLLLFTLFSAFVLKQVDAVIFLNEAFSFGPSFGNYGSGFLDFYFRYPGWIDFFLYFALFTALTRMALQEREHANRLAAPVALILSLSLMLYQARTGVHVMEKAALFVFILATLGLGWGSSKIVGSVGGQGIMKTIAFILGPVVFWVLAAMVFETSVFGIASSSSRATSNGGMSWWWLLVILFIIFMTMIVHAVRKNSSTGSFWGSTRRGFGRVGRGERFFGGEGSAGGRGRGRRFKDFATSLRTTKDIDKLFKAIQRELAQVAVSINDLHEVGTKTIFLNEDAKNRTAQALDGLCTRSPEFIQRLINWIQENSALQVLASAEGEYRRNLRDILMNIGSALDQLGEKPLKRHGKDIAASRKRLDKLFKQLTKLIEKLIRDCQHDFGKDVHNTSYRDVRNYVNDRKDAMNEDARRNRAAGVGGGAGGGTIDRATIEGLKRQYIATVQSVFDRSRPTTDAERQALRQFIDSAINDLISCIHAVEASGVSQDDFLSDQYLGGALKPPGDWRRFFYHYFGLDGGPGGGIGSGSPSGGPSGGLGPGNSTKLLGNGTPTVHPGDPKLLGYTSDQPALMQLKAKYIGIVSDLFAIPEQTEPGKIAALKRTVDYEVGELFKIIATVEDMHSSVPDFLSDKFNSEAVEMPIVYRQYFYNKYGWGRTHEEERPTPGRDIPPMPDNIHARGVPPLSREILEGPLGLAEAPAKSDRRSPAALKKLYGGYVKVLFDQPRKLPEDPGKRIALKKFIDIRIQALFTIIKMVQVAQIVTPREFLSDQIGGVNSLAPEVVYERIYARYNWILFTQPGGDSEPVDLLQMKERYMSYVMLLQQVPNSRDPVKNQEEKTRINDLLNKMKALVVRAEAFGLEEKDFLSDEYLQGTNNMQTPEVYYQNIYLRHGWEYGRERI